MTYIMSQRTQNPPPLKACRFDSDLGHHIAFWPPPTPPCKRQDSPAIAAFASRPLAFPCAGNATTCVPNDGLRPRAATRWYGLISSEADIRPMALLH